MKRFVTTRDVNGSRFGGFVDACDHEHAQTICDSRDLGETVEGVLYAIVQCDSWTQDDADKFIQTLAEEDPEPPDTEEFQ